MTQLAQTIMFTGIIQNTGTIKKKDAQSLDIAVPKKDAKRLKLGVSVAVNGACLTVVKRDQNIFRADILPETWKRTMFGNFKINEVVNIEFPVGEVPSFDGHIVQGHVDGVAKLSKIERKGKTHSLTFSAPKEILKYVVEKGSITINGISLTVVSVNKKEFSVAIIPHTWEITNLKHLEKESEVNIEVDILAKYAAKLANGKKKSKK